MSESLSGRVLHFMYHLGRLAAEDEWMAEEDLGPADFESAPPEDEPHDPNTRAEESAEYYRNVS